MTTLEMFLASLVTVAGLGLAYGLLRAARHGSRPGQFVKRTTFVFPDERTQVVCNAGQHLVMRDRAVRDGFTYDGRELYICTRHRFERKRQIYTDGQGAA